MLYFDWDPPKEAENLSKHGISFGAASVALEDPYAIEEDDQIVDGEQRLRTTGMAGGEVILLVTHANELLEEGLHELARIISARRASPGERSDYEQVRAAGGGYTSDR